VQESSASFRRHGQRGTLSSKAGTRSLDYAERWFHDGLAVCRPPAFHESIEVNMARMRDLIQSCREHGTRITYTHIFVRATALALAANPDLHAMICGSKVCSSAQVDIAVSIDSGSALAPVLIIEQAHAKRLAVIAAEFNDQIPQVYEQHQKMISILRRWGWLVPLSFLRRRLLRLLYHSFDFRRKGSGTFQVSTAPGVDSFATPLFNASGILTAGKVRDRVIAVSGSPAVRPTVILTCSADHRLWNGQSCQRFLLAVQEILEGEQLHREVAGQLPGLRSSEQEIRI
jgi:2-oxoacid dehydrogenases acyltransferase (catalytic domain)